MIDKIVQGMNLIKEANEALNDGLRITLDFGVPAVHIIRGSDFRKMADDRVIELRPRTFDVEHFPYDACFSEGGVDFFTLVLKGHEDSEDLNTL